MKFPAIIFLLLCSWMLHSHASAAEIEARDLGDGQSMIALTGEIESGDSIRFNRIHPVKAA